MSAQLDAECDGLCVTAHDVGVPVEGVAYPHPGCPLHDPGAVCACGQPDRCLSPAHGQVTMEEALEIHHRQAPVAGRRCPEERHVIAMLQYLGTLWPRSLTLISMDGNLHVMRTDDPRFEGEDRSRQERQEVIIADIDGIPNDGGSW